MDAAFGPANFRNEIAWCYAGGGIPKRDFPRKHDIILRYTKTDDYYYSPIFRPYSPGTVQRGRTQVKGKYFEEGLRPEGTPVNDWWPDVPKITSPTDPEKLGYPTQKSEALLERILTASSHESDLMLDPFCGCGTAVAVAQRLNRRWIGIDITHLAITLIRHRLETAYVGKARYNVIGEPVSLPDAEALAEQDKYQFQWWALGLVGARPAEQKKGADKGIDGRLYFHDEPGGKTKQIILSVKGGDLKAQDVRDLRGVIAREKAEIGVLLTLEEPTKPMRAEAASAGFYKQPVVAQGGQQYPRLQILTVAELLAGQRIRYPSVGYLNVTFKQAPRARVSEAPAQGQLPMMVAEPPAPGVPRRPRKSN